MRATATIEENKQRRDRDRRHRAAVPDELLVDRRAHPGARRRRRPRRHRRRQRRLVGRQDRARHHAQARRQRQRRAQQAVQADPAADELRDQHGRPRRRRAAHAEPRRRRSPATSRHQVDVITRRSKFRLDKARDREHILEGRIKALDVIDAIIALIRASDDAAAAKAGLMAEPFEFTERPGRRHPRHAAAPADPAVADRPRDRARRRARAHPGARGDPRRRRPAAQRDQGRAAGRQGGVRHAAGVPDHARRRRDVDRGPRRRQGARRRDDRGAVRQGRAGRVVQDAGPRWPRRQRRPS